MTKKAAVRRLVVHDQHIEVELDHPDEKLPIGGCIAASALGERVVRHGYDLDAPDVHQRLLEHVLHEAVTVHDPEFRYSYVVRDHGAADQVVEWAVGERQLAELRKVDLGVHAERARLLRVPGHPHPALTGRRP